MRKIAFGPVADSESRILILGTMPSEESLRKQERYGHKSNQFWKIVFTLFDKMLSDNYDEKIKLLADNHIAIWDVLHSCEGSGSLDSNIKNEKPNDFKKFFKQYPQIRHIFFTGKKAEEFYKKHVGFDKDRTYTTLPSPSSANARMSLTHFATHQIRNLCKSANFIFLNSDLCTTNFRLVNGCDLYFRR